MREQRKGKVLIGRKASEVSTAKVGFLCCSLSSTLSTMIYSSMDSSSSPSLSSFFILLFLISCTIFFTSSFVFRQRYFGSFFIWRIISLSSCSDLIVSGRDETRSSISCSFNEFSAISACDSFSIEHLVGPLVSCFSECSSSCS
jgi:hypothetical protein